jgi:hypothetical protein
MIETMNFHSRNGIISAKIVIYMYKDEVMIELHRREHVVHCRSIMKYIGWGRMAYEVIMFYGNTYTANSDEDWFRYRIRDTIESFSNIAWNFVTEDNQQLTKSEEDKKTEEQRLTELQVFVKSVKNDLKLKEYGG